MHAVEIGRGSYRNKDLLIPYVAPYVAYVAAGSILGPFVSAEYVYVARLFIVLPLIYWAWPKYAPLCDRKNRRAILYSIVAGLFAGIAGTVIWIVLRMPFAGDEASPWSLAGFICRLALAGFLVPIIEELLMRGYVFRLVLQWDFLRRAGAKGPFEKAFHEKSINEVAPGSWTIAAVIVSTVVFALGHETTQWPAAVAYGLLMAALWIFRKDLLSCIVAHGATNICLAGYIYQSKQWGLW